MFNLKTWWLAARPKTLGVSISPILMGNALALYEGDFVLWVGIVTCLVAVLLQIGTNFANDYWDFMKGADTHERVGPTRATQAGLVMPKQMLGATVLLFLLAALLGMLLVFRGGWVFALLGAASIAAGILYTAGPFALAYIGFAEIFVFIFFGLVATAGAYFLQTLHFNMWALIAGVAPGLLASAILTINNLRDIVQDGKIGKKTLAVRYGERFAKLEYVFCVVIAACIPIVLSVFGGYPSDILLSACVLIFAWPLIKQLRVAPTAAQYNQMLASTGKLLFLFSVVFCFGLFL